MRFTMFAVLTLAAQSALANTTFPLICRGNSSPTFTSGPQMDFNFTPDTAGPVTTNGLAIGSCGFVDRAMLPGEYGILQAIGAVQAGVVTGKFLQFWASAKDAYVHRLLDPTRYFFVYVTSTGSGFQAISTLGDAMDDAPPLPLPPGATSGTATAAGSTALPMLRNDNTPTCAISSAPDVYYHFVMSTPGRLQANTAGSGFDTVLSVVDLNGQSVACNDDADYTNRTSLLDVNLPAGEYYVVVDGYGAESGNFVLTAQLTF